MDTKILTTYREHQIDVIPLYFGTKKPFSPGWQEVDIVKQWAHAPQNANIGLRTGGAAQIGVIDCDDKNRIGSFDNVTLILTGYGVTNYPVVRTASGSGRHIILKLSVLAPGNFRNLRREVGAGELRYGPGAYVVAPPSVVNGQEYQMISGDLDHIPVMHPKDLNAIAPIYQDHVQPVSPQSPQSTVQRCSLSPLAQQLLAGHIIGDYVSPSDAEQALVTSLVNSGYGFEQVLALFMTNPCGCKFARLYARNPQQANNYLRLSYDRALSWVQEHISVGRQLAMSAINWALTISWPGRTGATDQAVYLAHANIAYRSGKIYYSASVRELGESSGVHRETSYIATKRLISNGLIQIVQLGTGDNATIYTLGHSDYLRTLPPPPPTVSVCTEFGEDAFRWGGLGKSAAEIWLVLQHGPMTVAELVELTGRSRATVRRALERMSDMVGIVDCLDGKWQIRSGAELARAAEILGTAGMSTRQRQQHDRERIDYALHTRRRPNGIQPDSSD